jgi:hypothetical protein
VPGREGLNRRAHARRHPYQRLIYTTKPTLDTQPSTPLYLGAGGMIVGVTVLLQQAPAADSTWDLLLDGYTAFHTTNKPTVVAGTGLPYSNRARPDVRAIREDTKIQVQRTTSGDGATGPAIIVIEYIPRYW